MSGEILIEKRRRRKRKLNIEGNKVIFRKDLNIALNYRPI